MFYCGSTNGFYINQSDVPAGQTSVEVEQAAYTQLLADQAQGLVIQNDGNGNPVALPWQASPALNWKFFQGKVKALLDSSDTTMARINEAISLGLTTATAADVVAYVQWRRYLRTLVSNSDVPPSSIPTITSAPPYPAGT